MSLNRRLVLKGLLAAAAAPAWAADRPRIAHPGVQLYTVRDELQRDFRGTLRRIAALGYREVEFAGYFDQSPQAIRALLDSVRLTAPSAHADDRLLGPEGERIIDAALTLGHRYLVIPWVDQAQWRDLDGWKRRADSFNRAGELCRRAGLQFCYHNHHFEFATLQGQRPYDLLLARCDARLVQMELDLCWAVAARQDPLQLLKAHPGRFPLVHLKQLKALPPLQGGDVLSLRMEDAAAQMTEVGPGAVDFAGLLADPASRGIRHFFVEHDQPAEALASIATSLRWLRTLQG
ncbi:sugar phosphate isomerase/epimerase [Pelomonas saccharophila]|uniref:Sugar phosphate isomerase/epimerase n=1 Tax=Roseateles saccharophilus TaxID=304 RepID=A0ABU1YUU2_ROSSA|nr:sugar phosphate isomerase/epimerase [Roseateles saccharophilus]MDR7272627.1 sugar phosphate isomerase/epimerase [Roseateles saccharophilus]